ncbi:DUF2511 domain-containing protein [Streptomyces angustmyceticus]|uniref:DUF2511 domain-containing protein n=1 Tax=Streptomyces angustmyceticus TaxID=285578 RepID=UPI0037FE0697
MTDEPRQSSKTGSAIAGGFLALVLILAFARSCGTPEEAPSMEPTESSAGTLNTGDENATAEPSDSDTRSAVVTASRFEEWPFTVDAGTLHCRDGMSVTFEVNGTEYGVNGTAQDLGYPSVKPIWADDQELGNGLKVDISEVLDYGRSLC